MSGEVRPWPAEWMLPERIVHVLVGSGVIHYLGATRMREVLDEYEAFKDAEIARLRAENKSLRSAIAEISRVVEAHDIESLSCDRDGEKYCECLRESVARALKREQAAANVADSSPAAKEER